MTHKHSHRHDFAQKQKGVAGEDLVDRLAVDTALTIEDELYINHFRVAIFGSARIKPDHDIYKKVTDLAKMIAENDIDIVTGGGPGIMEAANLGEKLADNEKSQSIGLTIELPFENEGNKHLDMKHHFEKFSGRLDTFMALSNAVVVMPGGIGTCLELFYTWQLTQVHHICNIPIILHGHMWHELYGWVKNWPVKNGLVSPEDLRNVFCVADNEQAMEIILDTQKAHAENGDDFCVNYKKYKLD